MADLTAEQLRDLQADLAIVDDETVWTDAELNRLYARAGESYAGAKLLAIEQLYMASLGENDYTAGQTSEKRSQITQNLKAALQYQWMQLDRSSQVVLAGLRSSPLTDRDVPLGHDHPALKSSRVNRAHWWRDPFRGGW